MCLPVMKGDGGRGRAGHPSPIDTTATYELEVI